IIASSAPNLASCIGYDTVLVTLDTVRPNANAGPAKLLTCSNSTVQLSGSSSTSGATFSWTGPGTIVNGLTATPTVNALGTYTVTVTNPANGCTNTSSTSVSTPPTLSA